MNNSRLSELRSEWRTASAERRKQIEREAAILKREHPPTLAEMQTKLGEWAAELKEKKRKEEDYFKTAEAIFNQKAGSD